MLDKNTIPPVIIQPGQWGRAKIELAGPHYRLYCNDIKWNQYGPKNMREYHEQWSGYDLAYGDVLLTGFGFGQMATWVANKPGVKTVTVIEKYQDVIDAFLANNKLPSNVNLILDDANTFKSQKKYDCIILDHISDNLKEKEYYVELLQNFKNINHDVLWFWSLEAVYVMHFYNISFEELYINPIDFTLFDFYSEWQKFYNYLKAPTIPNLSKKQLNSYINSFYLRNFIQ